MSPPTNFVFDGHRFHSEEHQRRFELIKDWSFLKETRVQKKEKEVEKEKENEEK